VVKLFQPVHGYEVRRELISWRAQDWASVQPGSIYNALKTLTRDGLLEVVGTDQVGGRPERTSYKLTAAGEDQFASLLRAEWWSVRWPIDPLMAAVSFLQSLPRAEAIAALEHRIGQIRGVLRQVAFAIDAVDGIETPFHVREMMRLSNARVGAEVSWAEQFLERLRNGEYSTADGPAPRQQPQAAPRGPASGPPRGRDTAAAEGLAGGPRNGRRARSAFGGPPRRPRGRGASPAAPNGGSRRDSAEPADRRLAGEPARPPSRNGRVTRVPSARGGALRRSRGLRGARR
jgi:DNA-binding PadR family transcriptional regulator